MKPDECSTCYGEGEVHSDAGPGLCPDCEGSGRVLRSGELIESRIREIEARLGEPVGAPAARWLIFELRRTRKALIQVLAYANEQADPAELPALLDEIRKLSHAAVALSNPARPAELLPEGG